MSCSVLVGLHSQIFEAATQRVCPEFRLTSLPLAEAAPEHYELYLPLTLADYAALRGSAGMKFMKKAIMPTAAAVEICDDKLAFVETLQGTRLHPFIPKRLHACPSTPFVLKKRRGNFGRGTVVVEDAVGRERADERLASGDYFAQDLVIGDVEYATHILISRGEIVYHFTTVFRMNNMQAIKGIDQNGKYIGTFDADKYLFIFRDALNLVGFKNGICCFDYKISDGIPRIFEINPRFGGSLTMDMSAFLRAYAHAVTMSQEAG